ncbi:MAG: DUF4405 domain-containing protein [Planctomycetota bacterium]|nr:MAG: DUF4405 domain-containing protein [Planctomycetota bacterium]
MSGLAAEEPPPGAQAHTVRGRLRRALAAWEDATGLGALARRFLTTPVRPGWARATGPALLLLLCAQLATGFGLALHYSPSGTTAWASVFYLEERIAGGAFVRGLHAYGASALVALLLVHVLAVGLGRRYRDRRAANWLLGLCLLPLIGTFALTGYLLPWDQKGYWATRVATGIVRGTPLVGEAAARALQGGAELGSLTLTRFFALHAVALPATLLLLLALHLRVWRRTRPDPEPEAARPYWPAQAARDLALFCGLLCALALAAHFRGAGLEAPADPSSDYPPRPEWYFAPLREVLKAVPEPWGSIVLPGAVGLLLAFLPWIDGPRSSRPRLARALLLLPFALWGTLLLHAQLADLADRDYQAQRRRAAEEADLAKALAREGVPGEGAAALLWRYPPRWGERLFERHCIACHEVDGRGGEGRPRDSEASGGEGGGSEAVDGDVDALGEGAEGRGETAPGPVLTGYLGLRWLREVIAHPESPRYFGRVPSLRDEMPPLEEAFLPRLDAIAAFVRAQDPAAAASLDPARIAAGRKAYFAAECNSCHSLKPGRADLGPNLAGYGSEDWLLRFLRDPGHELFYAEDNAMPAYGDELSADELRALVAYLRTLDGDPYPGDPRRAKPRPLSGTGLGTPADAALGR